MWRDREREDREWGGEERGRVESGKGKRGGEQRGRRESGEGKRVGGKREHVRETEGGGRLIEM